MEHVGVVLPILGQAGLGLDVVLADGKVVPNVPAWKLAASCLVDL